MFVSNAVIDGRYVLRACIVNFHTERADVEAVPEIVVRRGWALLAEQLKGRCHLVRRGRGAGVARKGSAEKLAVRQGFVRLRQGFGGTSSCQ